MLLVLNVGAAVRYVNVGSPTPVAPYTNWSTAARTIQAAIDASQAGDQVLVTNGIYQTSGRTFHGLVFEMKSGDDFARFA